MINLLTIEAKEKLVRDWHLRQLMVILGLVIILFLVAATFNIALWLNFNIQKQPLIPQFSLGQDSPFVSGQEANLVKGKISQLIKWWPNENWSELIVKIEKVQPTTAKINQIAGTLSEKDGTLNMVITGQTTNRQDLVKFVDDLSKDNSFSKVDLPIESLLIASNGQFTINLTVKNND